MWCWPWLYHSSQICPDFPAYILPAYSSATSQHEAILVIDCKGSAQRVLFGTDPPPYPLPRFSLSAQRCILWWGFSIVRFITDLMITIFCIETFRHDEEIFLPLGRSETAPSRSHYVQKTNYMPSHSAISSIHLSQLQLHKRHWLILPCKDPIESLHLYINKSLSQNYTPCLCCHAIAGRQKKMAKSPQSGGQWNLSKDFNFTWFSRLCQWALPYSIHHKSTIQLLLTVPWVTIHYNNKNPIHYNNEKEKSTSSQP